MKKDLIIARYNEDISWVSKLDKTKFNIFIYNKGPKLDGYETIDLPNFGRESETYLHHIVNNYDNISEHTIFLQGNPLEHITGLSEFGYSDIQKDCDYQNYDFDKCSNYLTEFLNSFTFDNEIVLLSTKHSDMGYLDEKTKLINLLKLNNEINYFTPGAQFIINKQLITNKPLVFWKNLHAFSKPNSDVCHVQLPYILERLWVNIFKTK
jgi:hypothetical protein